MVAAGWDIGRDHRALTLAWFVYIVCQLREGVISSRVVGGVMRGWILVVGYPVEVGMWLQRRHAGCRMDTIKARS